MGIFNNLKKIQAESSTSPRVALQSWEGCFDLRQGSSVYNAPSARNMPHEGVFNFLRGFVDRDHQFLDVGANIGQTQDSLELLGVDMEIISFEPGPYTFQVLSARKGHKLNVRLENCGLGDKTKKISLFTPVIDNIAITPLSTLKRSHLLEAGMVDYLKRISEGMPISIRRDLISLRTGDSFKLKPLILKVDAEGFEAEVIKGFKETISEFRPMIIFERNESCFDSLKKMNYKIYASSEEGIIFSIVDSISSFEWLNNVNFVAIPSEKIQIFSVKFNLNFV
jgi:FkbM family methyltransferase